MSKRHYVDGLAVLVGVVVAITVATVALTYHMGRHVIEQSRIFVANSPPVQQGPSATHAGDGLASTDPPGSQPELQGQDLPVMMSAQGVDGEDVRVGVAVHGKTAIDSVSRVSQPYTPGSSRAVELSPAVGGQGDRGAGNAARPAAHDADMHVQDSAPSVTSVALKNRPAPPLDTLNSDGPIQVAEPAPTAESASPAVNMATRAGVVSAAGDVTPASRDSPQPLSSGQTVVSTVSVNERIASLLAQAGEALSKDRLMIPAHRNAYSYYQQVLSQEPGNAEAHDGLKKVVERYVTLTRHALQRGDKFKANQYITRALRVRPGDRRLLAIKDRINTMLASTSSEPAATTLQPPPQEEEAPRTIFQRLRDFFILHIPLN